MIASVYSSVKKRQVMGTDFLRRLCNFLQISGDPGFKSRRERFIKQLCRQRKKGLQEVLNMVQVDLVRSGSS
ncbi:hypothetical protein N665_0116s0037 [Sinapis alba]|nr:hypothetical protein N665_0116s0037 [Sinapis alba]